MSGQSHLPRPLARCPASRAGPARRVRSQTIFRTRSGSETEHELATNILADYASDDPDRLAEPAHGRRPEGVSERSSRSPSGRPRQVLAHFQAELEKKATYSTGTTRRSTVVDEARRRAGEPDRSGPGPARRAVRLLPGDAAGRIPRDRRCPAAVGLSPGASAALCRWVIREGCGGLDPRRAEMADRIGPGGRRGLPARREPPAGEVHPHRYRRLRGGRPPGQAGRALRRALGRARRAGRRGPALRRRDRRQRQRLQYRAIVNARLGRKKEALDDLALLQKGAATESTKLYTAAVVAAELGEGQDEAFGRLEAALKGRPGDPGLAYDAACGYALASRALDRPGRAGGRSQAERAIQLLRAAIDNGYSDYDHIQEDSDLDPIRGLPAFGELIDGGPAGPSPCRRLDP